MLKTNLLLYAKPRLPPKWWPRDSKGKAEFAGVLKDGAGWSVGKDGDLMTSAQVRQARKLVELPRGRGYVFEVWKRL